MKPDQKEISQEPNATPLKRTKTSISVDVDLWREWGAELRRKGLNYNEAIEMLAKQHIENALANPKASQTVPNPPTRAELHQLLDEILDDGTLHIAAIQQNLELLAFAVRFAAGHSIEEMRALRRKLSEEKLRKTTVPRPERGKRT